MYEKKPGDLSIFRNDKKEKDSHPDYRGTGLTLDGRPMKCALWLKKDRNGNTFMAGKIEVDEYAENKSRGGGQGVRQGGSDGFSGGDRDRPRPTSGPKGIDDFDDSIPF